MSETVFNFTRITPFLCVVLTVLLLPCSVPALDNGLAQTPPMGWNSWNHFKKTRHDDQIIKETIDAMVDRGLLAAGYNYVVIDGGWRDTKLGPNGEMLTHPERYPKGVKWLADYAHSKGLKFGLHIVPGTGDCGGDKIGARGHEELHLAQYESWGVDFLKIDRCQGVSNEDLLPVYANWRDLFLASKHEMMFSISAYFPYQWFPEVAHMSRTSGDINANIYTAIRNVNAGLGEEYMARPGAWNDPDMLEIGNIEALGENRIHMALFCVVASPMFLGNDVRNMTDEVCDILVNKEALAINQDAAGIQGTRIAYDNKKDIQVWSRVLADGSRAVAVVNLSDEAIDYTVAWDAIGLAKGKAKVLDVWTKKSLGRPADAITVKGIPSHDCAFLKISGKPIDKVALPTEPFNVAVGATVTVDSGSGQMKPACVVREDNDCDGGRPAWNSAKKEGEHWIAIDFGAEQRVTGVKVTARGRGGMANYTIQSWDGKTWRTIAECPKNRYAIFYESFDPFETSRIRLLSKSDKKGVSCNQIKVFAEK